MVNALRTLGLICSLIAAAVSLYVFTMFWVGIDDNMNHKKAISKKPVQITGFINPFEQLFREKSS